jgi:hypothetical protein
MDKDPDFNQINTPTGNGESDLAVQLRRSPIQIDTSKSDLFIEQSRAVEVLTEIQNATIIAEINADGISGLLIQIHNPDNPVTAYVDAIDHNKYTVLRPGDPYDVLGDGSCVIELYPHGELFVSATHPRDGVTMSHFRLVDDMPLISDTSLNGEGDDPHF